MIRARPTAIVVTLVSLAMPVPASAVPAGPRCRSTAGSDAGHAAHVTVASFNVLHGLTESPPGYPAHSTLDARVVLAAAAIERAAVDVVGMQEVSLVEPAAPGSETPTLHATTDVVAAIADELAARTGERWHWCWWLANPYVGEPDVNEGGGGPLSDLAARLSADFVAPRYSSFKEGLAVLSRYPITASQGIHLPGRVPAEIPLCFRADDPEGCALTAGFERRAALWARVASPVGILDVTTTHLAHDLTDLSDVSSLEQAAAVVAFAEAKGADGVATHRFLVCDCNAQPEDDVPVVPAIESAGWHRTFAGDCATNRAFCTAGRDVIAASSPTRALDERLDYVFWRPGCNTGGGSSGRFADSPERDETGRFLWPSDHAGVFARVAACMSA